MGWYTGRMFKNTPAFSSFSVPDIKAAQKFYSETLGLPVDATPEGMEITVAGGQRIFVYPSSENKPAAFTILNFSVDDIVKTVDALAAKGVKMEQYDMEYVKTDAKGIARSEGGGPTAMAWFKDPAGNIIGVMQEK